MKTAFDKIIAIVDREQEESVLLHARGAGAMGLSILHARGTVTNDIMDLLGLEDKRKCMIQVFSRRHNTAHVMQSLSDHFQMRKAGHGIVFSIPVLLSKGVRAMINLRDDFYKTHKIPTGETALDAAHAEKEALPMDYEYEALYVISKTGHADEAMDAARAVGARGGTILHARGIAATESVKLFGIAIEPEKDVLMIIVKRDMTETVMNAINDTVGLTTHGQGILFSMPVTRIMGLAHSLDNIAK